jgi:citronellol/citronellal dehydrogenase
MAYQSIFKGDLFAGESYVVTGGGSGIGRCTAHELASRGATVSMIGRTAAKLERVAAEIAASGGKALVFTCDIREEEQVRKTVADIIDQAGGINGLVNNAGGQFVSPLADLSVNAWNAVIRNNLTGGFIFSRECYNQTMKSKGGAIVNIVADFWRGMPGLGHSGASRAGMANLTMTAAVEWAPSGVRVNAVAPGYVASSGLDTYPPKMRKHFQNVHRAVPLQRQATEAEISAAICFLLSPAASFITGVTLAVDGGASIAKPMSAWSSLMDPGDSLNPPWPLPSHTRSKSFDGFHLSEVPAVLAAGEHEK